MSSEGLHEPRETLPAKLLEMHRAIASLIEELEAVDWYAQRVAASGDEALREVLSHNRDEEKEHACMTLEWIRRNDPQFDALLRRILFQDGPIVAGEHSTPDGETPTLEIGSLRPRGSV